MAVNGRAKGAAGEREFADWLQRVLRLEIKPQRNLEQVRSGGADIVDVPPFLFEVKRCEQLSLRSWWLQVKTASESHLDSVPVVAYRQNRQPWRFLISANFIGVGKGFVQLEELEFKQWADLILNWYTNRSEDLDTQLTKTVSD